MDDSPIRLMQFESAVKHDPAVDQWFETRSLNLGGMARRWFDDPAGLLQGTGKRMRHVKLKPGQEPDEAALEELVESAYRDMGERLSAGAGGYFGGKKVAKRGDSD